MLKYAIWNSDINLKNFFFCLGIVKNSFFGNVTVTLLHLQEENCFFPEFSGLNCDNSPDICHLVGPPVLVAYSRWEMRPVDPQILRRGRVGIVFYVKCEIYIMKKAHFDGNTASSLVQQPFLWCYGSTGCFTGTGRAPYITLCILMYCPDKQTFTAPIHFTGTGARAFQSSWRPILSRSSWKLTEIGNLRSWPWYFGSCWFIGYLCLLICWPLYRLFRFFQKKSHFYTLQIRFWSKMQDSEITILG